MAQGRFGRFRSDGRDDPLCLRKRSFVASTDSGYDLHFWRNLAERADLTISESFVRHVSIRLAEAFLYLAVVGAFNLRVFAWTLEECQFASLAAAALRQVLDLR